MESEIQGNQCCQHDSMMMMRIRIKRKNILDEIYQTHSAWVVEYTDCITHNECPVNDTKTLDSEILGNVKLLFIVITPRSTLIVECGVSFHFNAPRSTLYPL